MIHVACRPRSRSARHAVLVLTAALLPAAPLAAADEPGVPPVPSAWIDAMPWRCIGPANMGGRITDLAVCEADPSTWWVASASGGLLKTTNNGVTFEHQFDHEQTVSIGDVAVAPSSPDIVWVGTGESNPRNSVSWGDGVYKSIDGGTSWTHMGLKASFQIGRIAIHPENPDIVYVGALGRLWGPNEERGLFKTIDGGATWERVLFIDENTGVIDVCMHPADPDTLLVATYERRRDGFDGNDPEKKWGPGAGLYRTTDGGQTFMKVTEGLPSCQLGRIGLDWHRADPNIVVAIIESERIGQEPENAAYAGIRGEDADVGARLTEVTEDAPAATAGLQVGDIVIAVEDETVHSYDDLLKAVRRRLAGDTVQVEVSRERKSVLVEMTFEKRPGAEEDQPAGGEGEGERGRGRRGGPARPANTAFSSFLGGQRENMQEQQGPDGTDFGGVYRSEDAGATWTRINSVNPRPMYFSQIRIDPSDPNHVFVLGISLYRSADGGKTFTDDGGDGGVHVDHHAMWIDPDDGRHIVLGNDGGLYVTWDRMDHWDHLNHMAIGQFYHVTVGPREDYRVYGGLQDNGSWGGPARSRHAAGPINEDWISIGGGDGFVCRVDREDPDQIYFESQNGGLGRINLRNGDRGFLRPRAPRGTRYRFNWRTPFILSQHNSRIYYTAGNHVFRSLDRGNGLRAMSPELTNTDRGSATALAESVRDADLLYVGTDDGALWATRNGGAEWVNLFDLAKEAETPSEETGPETAAEPEAEPATEAEAEAETEAEAEAETETEAEAEAEAEAEPSRRERPAGERPGGRAGRGGRMLEMIMQRDANDDGKIQRDEVPPQMGRMFDRMDANDDGVLDQAEIRAATERGGRRPGAGERPRGAGERPRGAGERPRGERRAPAEPPVSADPDDPVTGTWSARAEGADLPQGEVTLTFMLKLEEEGRLSGQTSSRMGDADIVEGRFDAETGKLTFTTVMDERSIDYEASLEGGKLTGRLTVQGGMFTLEFTAERTSTSTAPEAPDELAPPDDGRDWATIDTLLPDPRWVSSLEASRHETGRVYVTFDGHRSDDDAPYVFVSENFGRHWRPLHNGLPADAGSTRVLCEDLVSADVLYLGTEFGAWVSVDRGETWIRFTSLPTVAVHEFAQHPTAGEIVAATHGRSLWVLDVTPLRQMDGEHDGEPQLFRPGIARYWFDQPRRGGDLRRFIGENPSDGAVICYALPDGGSAVRLRITDLAGKTLRELEVPGETGLHRVEWDLRQAAPARRGGGGPRGARGGGGRFRRGPRVEPGRYLVHLEIDEAVYTQELRVSGDPEHPDVVLWGEVYDARLEVMEQFGEDEEEETDDADAGAL